MFRRVPVALAILSGLFTPVSFSACATAETAAARAIDALVYLASERVMTADRVAAAKWGTDKSIDDPAREKQVLEEALKRAADMGIDGQAVERIFRDQIEANKFVQRGLYERWEASSQASPTERPDLAKEIRPLLDRIGQELLVAIRKARPLLNSVQCKATVERSRLQAATAIRLDELHKAGLDRALTHVCR